MARVFRDEPAARLHSAEFTMLEWYRHDAGYLELMDDCEALLRTTLAAAGAPSSTVEAAASAPFPRLRYEDLFASRLGVDVLRASPSATSTNARGRGGISADADWDRETLLTVLWAEGIEPHIATDGPAFVMDYPADQAALARLRTDDPRFAERFELYVPRALGSALPDAEGLELANAFGELIDADEQRRRFEADLAARRRAGAAEYPMPEAMLDGLTRMKPTAGIALGIERLLIWVADVVHGWDTDVHAFLVP